LIVAPVWWERAYPQTNRALFNAVLKAGGGYLSIASPEAIPLKFVFFRRNEALAALSGVVVLGECPLKSGARNAMLHARRLGRKRFVQAFSYGEARAQGSFQELSRGDCELLYEPGPVIQALNAVGPFESERWTQVEERRAKVAEGRRVARVPRTEPKKRANSQTQMEFSTPPLPEDLAARAVACALLAGAVTVEQICEQSLLSPAEAQHQILLLTLGGLVAEDGRGLLRYHGAGHERR
jgi:predicted Rossmann fold nucleotide-binding protein DprA/Smf involved in DNA uptake